MTQGMKRLGMPVAALLGAALIGLIATSWFLNRDALREAVEAQIRAVTGLDLVVKGSIEVSVFPGSYVSFHDVGLKGGGTADPALAVDVLTANLRLLPLLLRRFEISDVMKRDVAGGEHRNVDWALDHQIEAGDGADLGLYRLTQGVPVEEPGHRDQADQPQAKQCHNRHSQALYSLGHLQ